MLASLADFEIALGVDGSEIRSVLTVASIGKESVGDEPEELTTGDLQE